MSIQELESFIKNSLQEDIKDGDHTSLACIDKNSVSKAKLLIKDDGIIAGIDLAERIFKVVDSKIKFIQHINDGAIVSKNNIAFHVHGNAISILKAERLVLNCMQRMSGIATKTYELSQLIKSTNTKILDTRKTTPLNRHLEKWAVKLGGGYNHRFGLYDKIMIKDNHIDYAQGIDNAINKTIKYLSVNNKKLDIIVEARNLNEVKQILKYSEVDRILLDNFSIAETANAVNLINNKCQTESSGDINANNILDYAKCGVDYISVGAITHSAKNFDLSLKAE